MYGSEPSSTSTTPSDSGFFESPQDQTQRNKTKLTNTQMKKPNLAFMHKSSLKKISTYQVSSGNTTPPLAHPKKQGFPKQTPKICARHRKQHKQIET
jgi:hypothetical protein